MTRDDIIRMAKEAGFERTKMHGALERFAYIVAAEREWVGLTDEEIIATQLDLWITPNDVGNYDFDLRDFARNIEAKLKEKNG